MNIVEIQAGCAQIDIWLGLVPDANHCADAWDNTIGSSGNRSVKDAGRSGRKSDREGPALSDSDRDAGWTYRKLAVIGGEMSQCEGW